MVQSLEAGDLVQALPGNTLEGFYTEGDLGTVQHRYDNKDGEKRILVVWGRTGTASSMREEIWEHSVSFIRHQRLEVGDLVRALVGKELTTSGVEYYKAGDEATVQSFADPGGPNEHVKVAWARTGQVSSIPTVNWMSCCQLVKKQAEALTKGTLARIHGLEGAKHLNGALVTCESFDAQKGRWLVRLQTGEEKSLKPSNLMIGKGVESLRSEDNCSNQEQLSPCDLVQVLPGNRMVGFYEAGDEGTVQEIVKGADGEERVQIVWARTGKAASITKAGNSAVRLVKKQVLEPGDTLEALPGMELVRDDKDLYKAGDEAVVIEFRDEPGQEQHVRLLWERTAVVSDLPSKTWMSFARIKQKGAGGQPGSPTRQAPGQPGSPTRSAAAGYMTQQAPQLPPARPPLKVGQRARVQGLQSAANRNGCVVECKSWDEGKGRWLVHIVTDECLVKPLEMSIKPVNLVAL